MKRLSLSAALLTFGLLGCGSPEPAEDAAPASPAPAGQEAGAAAGASTGSAVAQLQTADGVAAGSATATAADGGVMIALRVQGLPPGVHGVHVHTTGRCDPPTFETAGGHWNPTNATHGLEEPPGQHAGDMPNLTVAQDGTGTLEYSLVGATFEGLLDADGSAFVVHAGEDDQRTDPSGNSGDRIACGVFARG
ncbi:superoxide dismutase family protein [Brevundimonas sp.]|uniref:superoxide dismutase family protein n=1 Tax=Brevundimonas sp. TaxID=1871086 RepID=UPI0035B149F4